MHRLTLSLLAGIGAMSASYAALAQDRPAPQGDLTRAAAQERAAKAFERMDVNADGRIDGADREARAKARFDRMDANGDGSIDFAEFTAPRQPGAERAEGRKGERMGRHGMHGGRMGMRGPGRADADNDGTVTRAEMEAALMARFDAADADKDGVVTPAERKAHRDMRREERQHRRGETAG